MCVKNKEEPVFCGQLDKTNENWKPIWREYKQHPNFLQQFTSPITHQQKKTCLAFHEKLQLQEQEIFHHVLKAGGQTPLLFVLSLVHIISSFLSAQWDIMWKKFLSIWGTDADNLSAVFVDFLQSSETQSSKYAWNIYLLYLNQYLPYTWWGKKRYFLPKRWYSFSYIRDFYTDVGLNIILPALSIKLDPDPHIF